MQPPPSSQLTDFICDAIGINYTLIFILRKSLHFFWDNFSPNFTHLSEKAMHTTNLKRRLTHGGLSLFLEYVVQFFYKFRIGNFLSFAKGQTSVIVFSAWLRLLFLYRLPQKLFHFIVPKGGQVLLWCGVAAIFHRHFEEVPWIPNVVSPEEAIE